MALTLTPGYTWTDGEVDTAAKMNLTAVPTVADGQTFSANINGTVGATTPSTGAFTNITGSGVVIGSGGTGASAPAFGANGGSSTGGGAYGYFQRNSVTIGAIGTQSGILGDNSSNFILYTSAQPMLFYTNGTLALTIDTAQVGTFAGGINSPSIGATTPGTGKFTTLTDTALSTAGIVTNSAAGLLTTSAKVPSLTYPNQGYSVTTIDFASITTTTGQAVSALDTVLASGFTYAFEVRLYCSTDVNHGGFAAGVASDGVLSYNSVSIATNAWFYNANPASVLGGFSSSLPNVGSGTFAILTTSANSGYFDISGTINVNVGGTLRVQFCQQSASGTSLCKAGSWIRVRRIS